MAQTAAIVPGGWDRLENALMINTIETSLIGPMRLASALVEHLKRKPDAVMPNTGSWVCRAC